MTKRQICVVFVLLVLLFILIFTLNFYFLTRLNEQIVNGSHDAKSNRALEHDIRKRVKSLKPCYLNKNPRFYVVRNQLLKIFKPSNYNDISVIWDITKWWPKKNEVYPQSDTNMGSLIEALKNEPIISAKNSQKGTQFKMTLYLTGNQKVIFKPKWYDNDIVIEGPVYSGKDRHTSEIVGFYLGAVLNLRWTPVAVGRRINLEHIFSVADNELKKTMTINSNDSTVCVYGKCYYCKKEESICGDENNDIDGVILQLVPGSLSKYRSPWQRTYKDGQKAEWETNVNYCSLLKTKFPSHRLLDLIDVSIFDFLIQNGDRHHYETREDRVILIDNGKGFGNPNIDYLDVLAPLYQCCWIRRTTWERILFFSGGSLSDLIDDLTKFDKLYPIITEQHYAALNRRILLIYSTVETCIEKYGIDVLK